MQFIDKAINQVVKWESIDTTIPEMLNLIQSEILDNASSNDMRELEKGMHKTWVLGVGGGASRRYYPASNRPVRLCLQFNIFTHQLQRVSLQDTVNKKEYFVRSGKANCSKLQRAVLRRINQSSNDNPMMQRKSSSGGRYQKQKKRTGTRFFAVCGIAVIAVVAVVVASHGPVFFRELTNPNNATEASATIYPDYTLQSENSEGVFSLGNEQVLEYYHSSFAEFVHHYDQLTAYQRGACDTEANGRYLYLWGQVENVRSDGTVEVFCSDPGAQERLHSSFPVEAYAKLHVVPEQESELINLNVGDTIVAFGQIDTESYLQSTSAVIDFENPDNGGTDITGHFDLYESIIMSINATDVTIPVFQRTIPYISSNLDEDVPTETEPPETSVTEPTEPSTESNRVPWTETDEFWDFWGKYTVCYDPMAGQYIGPVVDGRNLNFSIAALEDADGNRVFLLSYPLAGKIIESDGEYFEVADFVEFPTENHSFTNRSAMAVFTIDEYYPEYSGDFVINLQYTPTGIEYSIYANIPGVLDTKGETWIVENVSESEYE